MDDGDADVEPMSGNGIVIAAAAVSGLVVVGIIVVVVVVQRTAKARRASRLARDAIATWQRPRKQRPVTFLTI